MKRIDLNADLGESFGRYTIGNDENIIPYITSANCACGFHAGDPLVMKKTISLIKEAGIEPGAHPGYLDLVGFGRRNMSISLDEAEAYMLYQLGALDAFVKTQGLTLQHVKPHGALYNMAAKDDALSEALCKAILSYNPDLIVLAQESGCLYKKAVQMGLPAACEVFADRAYEEDGTLVNRNKPGAMITDPEKAIERVLKMVKENKVETISGKVIPIKADSICVHGDSPQALSFILSIRKVLLKNDIMIKPLKEIV